MRTKLTVGYRDEAGHYPSDSASVGNLIRACKALARIGVRAKLELDFPDERPARDHTPFGFSTNGE